MYMYRMDTFATYLNLIVLYFHGLSPQGLGSPVQRLHVLVIQVDRLVTVRYHQVQILDGKTEIIAAVKHQQEFTHMEITSRHINSSNLKNTSVARQR